MESMIREFNNRTLSWFRDSRTGPDSPQPADIRLTDASGRVIGGLTASTCWGWLEIENFYIPEEWRGHGLGTRILDLTETRAVSRGCTSAQLTTYSFQGKTFYAKHGWQVVGTLEDYPPGYSYHWMRKDFS